MKIDLGQRRKVLMEKHTKQTEMELFVLSFLDDCEIKTYENKKYKDYIFYIKDGNFMFYAKPKENRFIVRSVLIWTPLQNELNINHYEARTFITKTLSRNINLNNYTIVRNIDDSHSDIDCFIYSMEAITKKWN